MNYFVKSIRQVSGIFNKISMVIVVAMTLLVCGNVVGRLFKEPILGTYDIVGFMGAVLFSFALAHCAIRGEHVAVTLVMDKVPRHFRTTVGIIISIISIGFFAMAAWRCAVYATDLWLSGVTSLSTLTPLYPFVYAVGFGCLTLSLAILVNMFESVNKVVKK